MIIKPEHPPIYETSRNYVMDKRLVVDVNKMCANCHNAKKNSGYVFSTIRK